MSQMTPVDVHDGNSLANLAMVAAGDGGLTRQPASLLSQRAAARRLLCRHPKRDWWEIAQNRSKTIDLHINNNDDAPLEYKQFMEAIDSQVHKKLNTSREQGHVLNEVYHVSDIQHVLEQHQFDAILQTSQELPNIHLPLLTFHCTPHPSHAQSIAKHGYLLPGDIHPATGVPVNMAHGRMYGTGIYSTTDIQVAQYYTFVDVDGSIQVIVNLLLPGKVHVIGPEDWDKKKNHLFPAIPINEHYYDGSHHRTPDESPYQVFISASSRYVVPVAILTMKPKWDHTKWKDYWKVPGISKLVASRYKPNFTKSLMQLEFKHIFLDYYAVVVPKLHAPYPASASSSSTSPPSASSSSITTHHYALVPWTQAPIVEPCHTFINSLLGQSHTRVMAMFYSNHASHIHNISKAEQFRSFYQQHRPTTSKPIWDLFTPLGTILKQISQHDATTNGQNNIHIMYVFVHPNITQSSFTEEVNNVVATYGSEMSRVIMKVVHLVPANRTTDPSPTVIDGFLFLKNNIQTEGMVEKFAHFAVLPSVHNSETAAVSVLTVSNNAALPTAVSLESALESIIDEQASIVMPRFRFGIPFGLGRVGEGFVSSLYDPPEWNLGATAQCIIYQGSYIEVILVDGVYYRTYYTSSNKNFHTSQAQKEWKHQQEMAAALSPHVIEDPESASLSFCRTLLCLLCEFRIHVLMYPNRIKAFMPFLDGLRTALTTELNRQQVEGVLPVSIVRSQLDHLNSITSDLLVYGRVPLDGHWLDQLARMKYGTNVAKRSNAHTQATTGMTQDEIQDLQKHLSLGHRVKLAEPSDALAYDRSLGYGLRVVHSNAAQVEPWLLMVDYVSTQQYSVQTMFVQSQLGNRDSIMDGDQSLTDVIVFPAPTSKERVLDLMRRMYTAYVFTRNPYLGIAGQSIALLSICWVRQVSSLMLEPRHALFPARFTQCAAFYDIIRSVFSRDEQSLALLDKIIQNDQFELYLTETYNVQSMCKILGLLSVSKAAPLLQSGKVHRFAFALLAESIMRSARILIRSQQRTAKQLLYQLFRLDTQSNLNTYRFDMDRAVRVSGQFFLRGLSNCTPFALVATYGFLQQAHEHPNNIAAVCDAFQSGVISMRNFLATHLPNCDKFATQVALYAQGLRFQSATTRHSFVFTDPHAIIEDIRKDCMNEIEFTQRKQQEIQTHNALRLAKRQQQGRVYRDEYHQGLPRFFTEEEVALMNQSRAADDQLEVLKSGLLVHHCAYPTCPQYLVNQATHKDRLNAAERASMSDVREHAKIRRHGLLKHMRWDMYGSNYVPKLHIYAQRVARHQFDEFKQLMNQYFHGNSVYSSLVTVVVLQQLWEFYREHL